MEFRLAWWACRAQEEYQPDLIQHRPVELSRRSRIRLKLKTANNVGSRLRICDPLESVSALANVIQL